MRLASLIFHLVDTIVVLTIPSQSLQKAVRRKIDFRVLSLVVCSYICTYMRYLALN